MYSLILISMVLFLLIGKGALDFYLSDEAESWKEEIEEEHGVEFKTTRAAIKFAEREFLDDMSKKLEEEYSIKKRFRTYIGLSIWILFHRRLLK